MSVWLGWNEDEKWWYNNIYKSTIKSTFRFQSFCIFSLFLVLFYFLLWNCILLLWEKANQLKMNTNWWFLSSKPVLTDPHFLMGFSNSFFSPRLNLTLTLFTTLLVSVCPFFFSIKKKFNLLWNKESVSGVESLGFSRLITSHRFF